MANNEFEFLIDEIEAELIPNLARFVKIPNVSRAYDAGWETNGLLKKACMFVMNWALQQGIQNMKLELLEETGRTPTILAVIENETKSGKNIMMYGHIDKQPPLTEQWYDGKKPYDPVYENEKLYGRGAGDDGYAFFSAILLIKTLQKFKLQKDRFVLFFESDEESASKDLIYFLQKNEAKIGKPDMVICLDSGTISSDRMCLTSSLRGCVSFHVKMSVLKNSVHSGDGSGIIPDSFRLVRHFLENFENVEDGTILLEGFNPNIPENHYIDAQELIKEMGPDFKWDFPFLPGVQPTVETVFEQYINGTWKPQMTMVGVDGIPSCQTGGNVIRPSTTLALSIRTPPNLSIDLAEKLFREYAEKTGSLYNAKLEVELNGKGEGFMNDKLPDELTKKLENASMEFFGKANVKLSVGGSIPFMGEFKALFPQSVFFVTGIMSPQSGMHGPNEYCDIKYLKKFLCVLLYILK